MLLLALLSSASATDVIGPSERWIDQAPTLAWIRRASGDLVVMQDIESLVTVHGANTTPLFLGLQQPDVTFGADINADGDQEVVMGVDGIRTLLEAYDSVTGATIGQPLRVALPMNHIRGFGVQIDGRGPEELVVESSLGWLHVFTSQGTMLLSHQGGFDDPAVPIQADADPWTELAFGLDIWDLRTNTILETLVSPDPTSRAVAAGDVDGDGSEDLLIAQTGGVRVYRGQPRVADRGFQAVDGTLFDYDADGDAEVIALDNGSLRAYAAVTGNLKATWPVPDGCCSRFEVVELIPGQPRLALGDHLLTDAGIVPLDPSPPIRGLPHVVDLDGDGTDEILWVHPKGTTITNARGQQLAGRVQADLTDHFLLVDIDNDGDKELLSTYAGPRHWHWDPAFGFQDQGLIAPVSLKLSYPAAADTNNDGLLEILAVSNDRIVVVDLANGQPVDVQQYQGNDFFQLAAADLDGDGVEEFLSSPNSILVYAPDMSIRATTLGGRFSVLPSGLLAVSGFQDVRLLRLDPGGFTELASLPVTDVASVDRQGQLWYRDGQELLRVDPLTGNELRFATPIRPVHTPVVLAGRAWLSAGSVVERWDLP